ncbi:MAG: 16S rRNA (guanine(966)-N(2))-methyltransferase RsmD [Candidatus Binatia bacterium]
MRITGGTARGRGLRGPRDARIRPTSDKVRGAIFNVLAARHDIEGLRILDLFAGTGALGLEALSRGAAHVTFVDASQGACRLIRENLERAGFADRADVVRGKVVESLGHLRTGAYDGALVDPPYRLGLGQATLRALAEGDRLAPAAWIVLEHAHGEDMPETEGRFTRSLARRYGDTALSVYTGEGE